MVTRQLQVSRRTGKVRRQKTDVLPPCHHPTHTLMDSRAAIFFNISVMLITVLILCLGHLYRERKDDLTMYPRIYSQSYFVSRILYSRPILFCYSFQFLYTVLVVNQFCFSFYTVQHKSLLFFISRSSRVILLLFHHRYEQFSFKFVTISQTV